MSIPLPPLPERSCTCHPDDSPPVPCPKKYALRECVAHAAAVTAAKDAEIERLRKVLWKIVYLRPDIEHPPLHSEAESIRILARAALGDKT